MHESEKLKWSHSVVPDLATPWAAAYQAPPSMGFSRQEYWSGVPLPSQKDDYRRGKRMPKVWECSGGKTWDPQLQLHSEQLQPSEYRKRSENHFKQICKKKGVHWVTRFPCTHIFACMALAIWQRAKEIKSLSSNLAYLVMVVHHSLCKVVLYIRMRTLILYSMKWSSHRKGERHFTADLIPKM